MGLDANVMCNCYQRGLTTEPPFPRDWLHVDDEGYLNLRSGHNNHDDWTKLIVWQQKCCEHPDMNYANERISNWIGYRSFQAALESVGLEHFPVLAEELPNANGGQMASESAALALKELEYFRQQVGVGSNAFLVNSKSKEDMFEHIAVYEGIFILDGRSGVDVGIGEFEFFIRHRETGADLFRATRFRQTLLDPDDPNKPYVGRVEYLDLETGETYVGTTAVSGKHIPWPNGRIENDAGQVRCEYPSEFHVEVREVSPNEFSYILEPLTTVFRAAVATGNPVRWC